MSDATVDLDAIREEAKVTGPRRLPLCQHHRSILLAEVVRLRAAIAEADLRIRAEMYVAQLCRDPQRDVPRAFALAFALDQLSIAMEIG
jgi:hypothetical protein